MKISSQTFFLSVLLKCNVTIIKFKITCIALFTIQTQLYRKLSFYNICFLSSVAYQIVKTNRPGHQRMNRGLSMEWEVRELLVCDSSSSLFSLFSEYHARNLATILSHLNVIFFHIYSKISVVFLTMALLFRCLLAYRLKKGECPPLRPASFF